MSIKSSAEEYQDRVVVVAGRQKHCKLALLICVAVLVLLFVL